MKKIALVGSSGGHLAHLLALRSWWSRYERFWVTFDKPDARSHLANERVYWCRHPTNRHLPNLALNSVLALRVLAREKPDLIVSCGAGAALPYYGLAPLFGTKTAFIEVVDRIDSATLTGRLVYRLTDLFIVQWESQRRHYPRSVYVGELL